MRHRVAGRKLGRKTNHRIAMWRNMAVSLFTHGQITTTVPKAKSLKPFVEKLISAGKKGDLASRRRVIKMLGADPIMIKGENDDAVIRNNYGEITGGPKVVKVLFEEIAPRYADRTGGYTRIIKLAKHRIGDGASLCVLQLVGEEESGPQVSGQYSRRRDKANKRMEFAAALRKGGATAVVEEEAPEAPAEEEAVAESPAEEAAAEEQAEDTGEEEKSE